MIYTFMLSDPVFTKNQNIIFSIVAGGATQEEALVNAIDLITNSEYIEEETKPYAIKGLKTTITVPPVLARFEL